MRCRGPFGSHRDKLDCTSILFRDVQHGTMANVKMTKCQGTRRAGHWCDAVLHEVVIEQQLIIAGGDLRDRVCVGRAMCQLREYMGTWEDRGGTVFHGYCLRVIEQDQPPGFTVAWPRFDRMSVLVKMLHHRGRCSIRCRRCDVRMAMWVDQVVLAQQRAQGRL